MYHVCNRGSRKGVIAKTYDEYCSFLGIVEAARQKFGMRIIAYNVVENHFHFLRCPVNDPDLPRFMKWMTQKQKGDPGSDPGHRHATPRVLRTRVVGPTV